MASLFFSIPFPYQFVKKTFLALSRPVHAAAPPCAAGDSFVNGLSCRFWKSPELDGLATTRKPWQTGKRKQRVTKNGLSESSFFTIPTELQQGTNVTVVLDGNRGVNVDVAKKKTKQEVRQGEYGRYSICCRRCDLINESDKIRRKPGQFPGFIHRGMHREPFDQQPVVGGGQDMMMETPGKGRNPLHRGLDGKKVVIAGRRLVAQVTFHHRQDKAAFLDLPVGTDIFTHEVGTALLEEPEIGGIVNHSAGIGVAIEDATAGVINRVGQFDFER